MTDVAEFEAAHPGATPGRLMQRAIELDEPDVVRGLAERPGFDPNAPLEPEGGSPMWTALREGNAPLTALLAERPGVSLEASMPEHDAWGWAPGASLAVLKALVEHFPEAAGRADADGATLLHAVVQDTRGPEKVAWLLDRPGVELDARQSDGTTPLYRAALTGNGAVVRLLLERPVDVNAHNDDNRWTVLMVAVAGGHADIVAELLAQPSIDANARDDRGFTALHLAAERGDERIVALLAAHPGIDVNAKDDLGRTALTLAAFNGSAKVVGELLAHPAIDVNLVDRHRQTALHWAALAGHLDVVYALVSDERTNPGITNRPDGRTAQEVADEAGHRVVADLLAKRMATDPGSDELSPGDSEGEPPPEPPVEVTRPFVPEPPR